jgi:DNA repair exonuclease SbcCD ATPase subunit
VASTLDSQIDELYQLPLEQFTEKRNALAKELQGSAKTQVQHLIKPSLPMWAINQLYWRERPTYSALVDASEKVRAAHRALLSGPSGQKTDVRKPDQVHRAAIERAVAKTLAILATSGLRASGSALDTIRQSLAALPTDEPRGRMTRPPEPSGFSLLTGVKPQAVPEAKAPRGVSAESKRKEADERQQEARRQGEQLQEKQRKEEQRQQERAEKARQFARAQAARKLERAKQEAEQSASRLEAARRRLAELEKD